MDLQQTKLRLASCIIFCHSIIFKVMPFVNSLICTSFFTTSTNVILGLLPFFHFLISNPIFPPYLSTLVLWKYIDSFYEHVASLYTNIQYHRAQWAPAQLAPPPLANARWRVWSWIQDPLNACLTQKKTFYQFILQKPRNTKALLASCMRRTSVRIPLPPKIKHSAP